MNTKNAKVKPLSLISYSSSIIMNVLYTNQHLFRSVFMEFNFSWLLFGHIITIQRESTLGMVIEIINKTVCTAEDDVLRATA